jgi:hypothetical protein
MQGPATHPSAGGGPRPSLSQRAFPRRVRALLEGVLDYVSDQLDRGLVTTMNELEQQLFKMADQARSSEVQKHCMEALREIKRGRADVTPRFLLALEAALATIKDPPKRDPIADKPITSQTMSLVEDVVMDENTTLNEIASRAEIRNSLPLFLLGQRFGVVAGRPAFDAETLPVGPHALCSMLREAVAALDLNSEQRQLFYRQFDRSVLQFVGPLYEALNTYLIKQKVLPHLTYVPMRVKPAGRPGEAPPKPRAVPTPEAAPPRSAPGASSGAAAAPAGDRGSAGRGTGTAGMGSYGGLAGLMKSAREQADGLGGGAAGAAGSGKDFAQGAGHGTGGHGPGQSSGHGQGAASGSAPPSVAADATAMPSRESIPAPSGPRPYTAWPGVPDPYVQQQAQQDTEMFDVLRQLLAGRRSLIGKLGNTKSPQKSAPTHVVAAHDVQDVLGQLQMRPAAPVMVEGKPQPRSITHLKQDLLAQLRKVTPDGHAPALPEEHGDTIDLVGMLFDHIMKDVRPQSPAAQLLTKLQVPLLRVALDDKGFFTRKQHPARQMLNTIAESGAYWSSEDEADRTMVDKMHMLVDRVSSEFKGDMTLFDALLGDLSSHMQTQARKAEVAERRHVEAARGKEKLELARVQAAEAIDAKLHGKRVPKFLHTLLAQAWSDVLALSLLRGGEDSENFRRQLQIAERLIESAVNLKKTGKPLIEQAEVLPLKAEIEDSLAQVGYHGNDAQAISGRLLAASGEEEEDDPASRTELTMRLKNRTRLGQSNEAAGPSGEKLPPLDAAEKACLDRIRHLPFGTWFDFVVNQQGELSRRRLSWYSTMTGHCLFVNHRGQRIAELTLEGLAREMNRGQLRVVQAEQDSMIDRAWNAIVGALRTFSGRPAAAAQTAS